MIKLKFDKNKFLKLKFEVRQNPQFQTTHHGNSS